MGDAIKVTTGIPGPRSAAVLERKRKVVCDPLDIHVPAVIDSALGARFTDIDGNRMLDFSAGLGCQLVGYSHPKVVEAVQQQAARVSHTDFSVIPYESFVQLAEGLVERVGIPGAKVAMFNSGAEAIENAVKFARAATGRPAVISFEGAFHGRTLLTMSLTSRHKPYKTGFGPFAPETYRLPYAYPYRSHDPDRAARDALDAFDRAFVTVVDPKAVAAVIVEPIQGEGGFVVPPAEFLRGIREACTKHGIVVIADEVQSGTGRTGTFLASEQFGFSPDLVVLAKALASGYPLSAVVGRAEIMDAPGPSAIGGTYVGNPVACAAANAVLQVIDEEGLLQRSEQIGKTVRARWEQIARRGPRGRRDPGRRGHGRCGVRRGTGRPRSPRPSTWTPCCGNRFRGASSRSAAACTTMCFVTSSRWSSRTMTWRKASTSLRLPPLPPAVRGRSRTAPPG